MPAVGLLNTASTIAASAALLLRGVQTDPNGVIQGGHYAVYDFTTFAQANDACLVGQEVPNLVYGQDPAVGLFAFPSAGFTAAKGAKFTAASNSATAEVIELSSKFDLRNIGATPSVAMGFWVTQIAYNDGSATASIAGYAYATTTECQWSLSHRNSTGNYTRFRMAGCNANAGHDFGLLPLATPKLLVAVVRKTGATTCTVDYYLGADRVQTYTNGAYPLKYPITTVNPPRLGVLPSYDGALDVVVHRAFLFEIDPAFHDQVWMDAWVADEFSRNAARFA